MADTSTTPRSEQRGTERSGRGVFSRLVSVARAHRGWTATVLIAGVGLLIFGLVWFQPQKAFINTTVSEDVPPAGATGGAASVLASGSFRGLDHDASGDASLVEVDGKRFVRFEKNFRVLNGPDLVVYLSKHPASSEGREFARDFVNLGGLKGNRGSQNYTIPSNIDPSDYRSVVVWCRRFNVGFAVAPLET